MSVLDNEPIDSNRHLDDLLSSIWFDIIPDACIVFDYNWRIIKINPKAEQIFLLPKEYLMSKTFWEIAPQYVNTDIYFALVAVRTEKREIYKEFNGSTTGRWFSLTAKSIGNHVVVFFKDISIYKHSQVELVNSEERFSVAFRHSPAIMSILSLNNGRFISINDAYTRYTGYFPIEVVGKTKEEANILCKNNLLHIKEQYLKNEPVKELSVIYVTKTGEHRNVVISSEKININGEPCLLEVGIDITDTVKYQSELEKFQRFNLIGQMSAAIAHEIRNPLQAVKGFLQLFSTKPDINKYSNHLKLMIDELNRANQIISEYLSLSRIKPTELQLEDINEIIEKILPLVEAQAAEEDKCVETELNQVPKIWLDESEIKQLILNLTKNGLEAIKKQQTVKITTKFYDNKVILSVSDQGPGLPEEIQAKIGTPFITTKQNGTGIGLTMSYSIAKRHKAEMKFVTSQDGTTFYLYLPTSIEE